MTAPEVTPAVERAERALVEAWHGTIGRAFHPTRVKEARAGLAAALDRQEIAKALYEHHAADVEWRDQVTLCDWADVEQTTGEAYLEQADGVIATVLGDRGDGAPDPWAARLSAMTGEPTT